MREPLMVYIHTYIHTYDSPVVTPTSLYIRPTLPPPNWDSHTGLRCGYPNGLQHSLVGIDFCYLLIFCDPDLARPALTQLWPDLQYTRPYGNLRWRCLSIVVCKVYSRQSVDRYRMDGRLTGNRSSTKLVIILLIVKQFGER